MLIQHSDEDFVKSFFCQKADCQTNPPFLPFNLSPSIWYFTALMLTQQISVFYVSVCGDHLSCHPNNTGTGYKNVPVHHQLSSPHSRDPWRPYLETTTTHCALLASHFQMISRFFLKSPTLSSTCTLFISLWCQRFRFFLFTLIFLQIFPLDNVLW